MKNRIMCDMSAHEKQLKVLENVEEIAKDYEFDVAKKKNVVTEYFQSMGQTSERICPGHNSVLLNIRRGYVLCKI